MKRYKYNMHNQWITASRIGELLPVFHQEVTPGDTWRGRSFGVFKLAPLNFPAYMSLKVFVHFFFVPHRLVWNTALGDDANFEDVITGSDTGTWPTISTTDTDPQWLDWGVGATPGTNDPAMNALPIRAFNLVYNDHFRNHLIESERSIDSLAVARVRFPSNDYYGSIATEIQQGTEETIDSSGATIPITEIRDAWNRQRLKERRSLYGERYRDLLASYGVRAPDYRLDRPEHCARGVTTIGISEVVATATSASENTGEYRGHGTAGIRINFPKRNFPEHGTLIGVMYARPRLQLRTRHDHQWKLTDKEDLYHPELATDSMVTVGSNEVYSNSATETNFGYHPRYEYLRSPRDTIAGMFQTAALEEWTAHVDLSSVPTVSYLQQVQDYDHIYQDQTSGRADLHCFFDHRIGKLSIVKPRSSGR